MNLYILYFERSYGVTEVLKTTLLNLKSYIQIVRMNTLLLRQDHLIYTWRRWYAPMVLFCSLALAAKAWSQ